MLSTFSISLHAFGFSFTQKASTIGDSCPLKYSWSTLFVFPTDTNHIRHEKDRVEKEGQYVLEWWLPMPLTTSFLEKWNFFIISIVNFEAYPSQAVVGSVTNGRSIPSRASKKIYIMWTFS